MTAGRSDLIDVAVEVKHKTEKAVLVSDGDRDIWLPNSQIELDGDVENGFTVTLPEWLAFDKGLI